MHASPQISLLVPFRASPRQPHRLRLWSWLEKYWGYELPDAEIVIGRSFSLTFSKTEAVNDAASRATGRIFVIVDSDTYIRGTAILHCAREIEEAQRRGHRLWFVPYRHLYRLTEGSTARVLASDPKWPLRFPSPPPLDEVESTVGSMHGHHFGAMIQVMPRDAFELVGGMDPRFNGWGGEDVSFLRAVDTLYGRHKTVKGDVLHLWHPNLGDTVYERRWEGQASAGTNAALVDQYNRAFGDRVKMLAITRESRRRSWFQRTVVGALIRWFRR